MSRPTEADLEFLKSTFAVPRNATLADLDNIRKLPLGHPYWNDDTLAHLTGLTGLEIIEFHNRRVGDRGLEHLVGLPRLKSVNLNFAPITDAALATLARLPAMESLTLHDTR